MGTYVHRGYAQVIRTVEAHPLVASRTTPILQKQREPPHGSSLLCISSS